MRVGNCASLIKYEYVVKSEINMAAGPVQVKSAAAKSATVKTATFYKMRVAVCAVHSPF